MTRVDVEFVIATLILKVKRVEFEQKVDGSMQCPYFCIEQLKIFRIVDSLLKPEGMCLKIRFF